MRPAPRPDRWCWCSSRLQRPGRGGPLPGPGRSRRGRGVVPLVRRDRRTGCRWSRSRTPLAGGCRPRRRRAAGRARHVEGRRGRPAPRRAAPRDRRCRRGLRTARRVGGTVAGRPQRSSFSRSGEPLLVRADDDDWEPDTEPGRVRWACDEQSLETVRRPVLAARGSRWSGSPARWSLSPAATTGPWPSVGMADARCVGPAGRGRPGHDRGHHPRAGHRVVLPGGDRRSGRHLVHGGTAEADAELGRLLWPHLAELLAGLTSAAAQRVQTQPSASASTSTVSQVARASVLLGVHPRDRGYAEADRAPVGDTSTVSPGARPRPRAGPRRTGRRSPRPLSPPGTRASRSPPIQRRRSPANGSRSCGSLGQVARRRTRAGRARVVPRPRAGRPRSRRSARPGPACWSTRAPPAAPASCSASAADCRRPSGVSEPPSSSTRRLVLRLAVPGDHQRGRALQGGHGRVAGDPVDHEPRHQVVVVADRPLGEVVDGEHQLQRVRRRARAAADARPVHGEHRLVRVPVHGVQVRLDRRRWGAGAPRSPGSAPGRGTP